MMVLSRREWDAVLVWRAAYLAWHRQVTGRQLTGFLMPFQVRRQGRAA